MEPITVWECALRLVLSTLLGAGIGLEREHKRQAAGFRTHTIICVGSTLIMLLSMQVGGDRFDPGRIAAQVVSGIGFLGAGAILRMGPNVKGLTTAATIWTVAAIGLALGFGLYFEAALVWLLLFSALYVFNIVEKRVFRGKRGQSQLSFSGIDAPGIIAHVTGILESHKVSVGSISLNRNPLEGKVDLFSLIHVPAGASVPALLAELQAIPGCQEVEIV